MVQLRDYQEESVAAVIEYWGNGGGNALVDLPTGSGKSLTMAELMRRLYTQYEGTRILLMTHVQELVEQDAQAVQQIWPEAPIGIYSAGLNRRDRGAPIVLASVQSIFRSPEIIGLRHVVFIDEAHLLSRRDDGQYQRVLRYLRTQCPSMRLVGFTATPYRTDSGLLTQGWRDTPPLFDDVVYRKTALDLIRTGILAPLVPYAPDTRLDVTGVRRQGGDFVQHELQAAVDKQDINERAVDEMIKAGESRIGWIVFAAGVEHARHLRDVFRMRGIDCEMVLGETPQAERREIIQRFKTRDLRCVVGNNVLTTGFDARHIDLIGMLRPTESKGLLTQMLGRGLRVFPGKDNCAVLDFAGNMLRHGPLDLIDGAKTEGVPGKMPLKECEQCHAYVHISAKWCPHCQFKFPIVEEPKYAARPQVAPIFSDQQEPVWHDVDQVLYRRHTKKDTPDSFRIDYICGLMSFSHWLALGHETAAAMARGWWARNSYSGQAPATVTEALLKTEDLRIPGRIQVVRQGKYDRVIHWDYSVPAGKVIPTQRMIEHSAARFLRRHGGPLAT